MLTKKGNGKNQARKSEQEGKTPTGLSPRNRKAPFILLL
jgi:hypothetical protein